MTACDKQALFKGNINALIFDLGNVLINFDHWIAVRKLSDSIKIEPLELFSLFFNSGLTQLFEEGKLKPEEFFLKIKELLGLQMDYASFLPIWNEIFFITDDNTALYEMVRNLKKNYKVALLSNINALHFSYLKEKFPVFDIFSFVMASYEMGCVKPDPVIYMKTLDALKVLPEETFYTDDRPELIEAARSLGIQAAVYRGVEQLKKDMAFYGIRFN